MSKVRIDAAVALQEAAAEIEWLRQRNLLLAQALADERAKTAKTGAEQPAAGGKDGE